MRVYYKDEDLNAKKINDIRRLYIFKKIKGNNFSSIVFIITYSSCFLYFCIITNLNNKHLII